MTIAFQEMRLAWRNRAISATLSLGVITALSFGAAAQATNSQGTLALSAVDASGNALEHVVVSLHSATLTAGLAFSKTTNVMDQKALQFSPSVLAVQSGTRIKFPNQDDVRHHVYSFSHPNAFELKLYHGQSVADQLFEHEGVVVLGCNIHDGMLGYLRVVDTPLFGTSDATGNIVVGDIPPGDYEMQVWHPDIGMTINRSRVNIAAGTKSDTITVTTQVQEVPALKAAHPLQSLFR